VPEIPRPTLADARPVAPGDELTSAHMNHLHRVALQGWHLAYALALRVERLEQAQRSAGAFLEAPNRNNLFRGAR
jgi:hypothetical protein